MWRDVLLWQLWVARDALKRLVTVLRQLGSDPLAPDAAMAGDESDLDQDATNLAFERGQLNTLVGALAGLSITAATGDPTAAKLTDVQAMLAADQAVAAKLVDICDGVIDLAQHTKTLAHDALARVDRLDATVNALQNAVKQQN